MQGAMFVLSFGLFFGMDEVDGICVAGHGQVDFF